MNPILVTVTVESFDHFLKTFQTRGLPLRQRHGSQGVQVMRHADDDTRVSLLFDWEAEAFRGFLDDPEVKESMRAGGTQGPPQIQFFDQVERMEA